MISLSPQYRERLWSTVSFPSTLHLHPVLELLLARVPSECQSELRLGLQEALVNAAKHGNRLDLRKPVVVRFSCSIREFRCVICDQGEGFSPPSSEGHLCEEDLPCDEQACGRGLYILHQVFDQVHWNSQGTELRLYKRFRPQRVHHWLRASLF